MSQPVDAAADPRIRSLVEQVVREIMPDLRDREIPGDQHLKDLGADSVDRVEIVMTLIERLGLDEGMSGFADLADVDAMVGYLAARTARR
jgi:polyketide biosynthesis acyl carrier protein